MNAKRLKARTQAHSKNILTNLAVYFLLIGIGFVFLYPLLYDNYLPDDHGGFD